MDQSGRPINVVEEKRGAPRHKAADVPAITSVRLSPLGIQARLIDISTTGALVECPNRIQPKSTVSLSFDGPNPPQPVSGRVARTTVAALDGGGTLRYHVGIAFATPIALNGPLAEVAAAVAAVAAAPVAADAAPIEGPPRPAPRNRW